MHWYIWKKQTDENEDQWTILFPVFVFDNEA